MPLPARSVRGRRRDDALRRPVADRRRRLHGELPLRIADPQPDFAGPGARLADLIGWYARILKETHARPQEIDRHLVSLSGQTIDRDL